jgi:glycoprotein J
VPDVFSRRIPFLTALAAIAALTALSFVPVASAKTCAEQVIDDWYGNGRVDQIFPKHCYLEAIRSLPVDVKDYSNAEEDIRRALAFAGQGEPDPGPSGGPAPTGTNGEDPPGTTPTSPTTPPDETSGTGETIAGGGVDTSGPSSLPIPLLVLGGLALLLLAAGGAGYLSRRAQARRNGGPPGPA